MRFFSRKRVGTSVPSAGNRKTGRRFLWLIIFLVIGIIGWIVISGIVAMNQITAKNSGSGASFFKYAGDIPADQLNGEGDGRVNILLLGIGGQNHPGGMLADSIEILSIDPVNKKASFLSVPRDLYVPISGYGRNKINTAYADGWTSCQKSVCSKDSDPGGDLIRETLSKALGQPIQYYLRLDFEGFEKVIDQLGGVQVYVDKPINDPYYPDEAMVGYSPLRISAGLQTFNGKTALKYARSRETTSDFDRSRRQQQIMLAVKEKATRLNFLTNPKKVTDIIGTLGTHIRTDLQTNDWLPLLGIIRAIDTSKIVTQVLDTGTDSPLKSLSDPSAGYIIVPKLGMNDFTEVQEWVAMVTPEPYLLREKAKVSLVTPTNKPELGVALGKFLKALGYNISSQTTSAIPPTKTTIEVRNTMPYTTELLKKRFKATVTTAKGASTDADIILTIGSTYQLPHAYVGLRQPNLKSIIPSASSGLLSDEQKTSTKGKVR